MSGDRMPLFVYGELMAGGEAAGLLGGLPRCPARIRGRLHRLPGGRPVLVLDPAGGWVYGELVEIDRPARLRVVDLHEASGRLPLRRVAARVDVGLDPRRAWVHVATLAAVRRARGRPLRTERWREGWRR